MNEGAGPHPPSNRRSFASRLARRPFVWMLAALLCLLVLIPADRNTVGGRFLAAVLFTAAFLAGFAIVFKHRRQRLAGLLTGVPAAAAIWAGLVMTPPPPPSLTLVGHGLSILFLAVTTTEILKTVFRLADVTTDAVAGALCGYLLLGVAFGHAYTLIELSAPGSFLGGNLAADGADPGKAHAVLTYFSVATLTTVGYGDVTPATGVTRGLANVEAIVGQFYLAVVVADLIGKRVALALAEQGGEPTGR
jgi:voltage-gated potassium channel Kch